jgi:5'-3' exonuclease
LIVAALAYGMPALSFNGDNTHIIYGFLRQILTLAEKFKTNQFVFCWDSRQSYRKAIDPGYKKRVLDPTKEQLIADAQRQFALLYNDVLPMMGFKNVFLVSGYEADDLMAWICYRKPDDYVVVSADEDMWQLLHDDRFCPIRIYDFKKEKIINEIDFTTKYGLKPIQWTFVKAMAGCSSDTVKGIPGIGEDTAIKYLNGVLKDGKAKEKIDCPEGQREFRRCLDLVALPFSGDRPIQIPEIEDDVLYSLDFMDAFKKYGCDSFVSGQSFEPWRKVFQLISGRV